MVMNYVWMFGFFGEVHRPNSAWISPDEVRPSYGGVRRLSIDFVQMWYRRNEIAQYKGLAGTAAETYVTPWTLRWGSHLPRGDDGGGKSTDRLKRFCLERFFQPLG